MHFAKPQTVGGSVEHAESSSSQVVHEQPHSAIWLACGWTFSAAAISLSSIVQIMQRQMGQAFL